MKNQNKNEGKNKTSDCGSKGCKNGAKNCGNKAKQGGND